MVRIELYHGIFVSDFTGDAGLSRHKVELAALFATVGCLFSWGKEAIHSWEGMFREKEACRQDERTETGLVCCFWTVRDIRDAVVRLHSND